MMDTATGAPMAQPSIPPGPGGPPGMMPGGAPPMAPPVAQGDPNIRATLHQRMMSMSPQDADTFIAGISPDAVRVLRKLIPELAPELNALLTKHGHGIDAGQGAPMPGGPPGGMPPPPMQGGAPPAPGGQPPSRLARFSA